MLLKGATEVRRIHVQCNDREQRASERRLERFRGSGLSRQLWREPLNVQLRQREGEPQVDWHCLTMNTASAFREYCSYEQVVTKCYVILMVSSAR